MNAKESAFEQEMDEILRSLSDGTGASVEAPDEDNDYTITELMFDLEDHKLATLWDDDEDDRGSLDYDDLDET